jgi:DNA-binding GntR family transcriptional regulator
VRLRDNLRALNVAISAQIVSCMRLDCTTTLARELLIAPRAPIWCIDILNCVGDLALSISRHRACATVFPELPDRLQAGQGSFTAAFSSYDIADYERRSTQITARLPNADEAAWLGITPADPVLSTRSLDITAKGAPLQVVEAAFRGDRIELRVEID